MYRTTRPRYGNLQGTSLYINPAYAEGIIDFDPRLFDIETFENRIRYTPSIHEATSIEVSNPYLHIFLGHELCHAYYMYYETEQSFLNKDSTTKTVIEAGFYLYRIVDTDAKGDLKPKTYVAASANAEETHTVGLRGDREFTENVLRSESGLPKRAAYNLSYEEKNMWNDIESKLQTYNINLEALFTEIYGKMYTDRENFPIEFLWK